MNNKRNIATTMLLVDNEPDNTSVLSMGLEDEGFKVDVFNDPILALSNFKPNFYALSILDINMPNDASHNNSLTIDEDYKLLDIIVRNAKKLLLLEENILDVARIENKSLKLDIEECDLDDVIASVVQDTRDQIDNSRVELLYNKGEDGILMVLVDKSRLEQVLSNLLSNSIKFTKAGTISLNVEEKDNQALVTVKDTGPGIDPEMLPRLFSKFATKSERGAGLGLFICKNIIEAHGGRIWAENNSDGKGAKFSFSLAIKN